jgi:hypothetical protein
MAGIESKMFTGTCKMNDLNTKNIKEMPQKPIIVVSGLPRSGTSMMMQILETGGIKIFRDDIRLADADNPKGYYEFERVKELDKGKDKSWLGEARGSAIKVISQLLKDLPQDYFYKVIFMLRNLGEVVASQNQMLARRDKLGADNDDDKILLLLEKHLKKVREWVVRQPNIEIIEMEYGKILADPAGQLTRLRNFLGMDLNVKKMAEVIDDGLYRNRH